MKYLIVYSKQDLSEDVEFDSLAACFAYIRTEYASCLADDDVFYINNVKYRYDKDDNRFFKAGKW